MFHLVLFSFRMQSILFDGPVGQEQADIPGISDAAISGWKKMFPGDEPRCDAGGCQKVVLTELQARAIPAGMIHMVETHSESVALGVNFIHCGHLLTAAAATAFRLANLEELDSLFQHHRWSWGDLPVGALPAQISVKMA